MLMTEPAREIVTVIGRPSGMATMMTMRANVMFSMSFLRIKAPFLSLSEKADPRASIMTDVARTAIAEMIPM